MSYQVKHRVSARQELEQCRVVYRQFAADVETRVAQLADAVEQWAEVISIDLGTILDLAGNPWGKALADAVRKRRPCSLRVTRAKLSFLGLPEAWQIHIYYEVDPGNRWLIVTKYDGLPGQQYPGES